MPWNALLCRLFIAFRSKLDRVVASVSEKGSFAEEKVAAFVVEHPSGIRDIG